MFNFKKKKTGIQTPELRKPTPPPEPIKFEDLELNEKWKHRIRNLCGKLANEAEEVSRTINESGLDKPTLVIKLFSDNTYIAYINEEDDEKQYIGGTEE